ncbi:MAG: hypothetical protein E7656_08040 [Ruminococcaceae bacterium]|nr:hypothetical protein [Oscillospiraceae bacterium]
MKKYSAVFLILVVLFQLCGCSSSSSLPSIETITDTEESLPLEPTIADIETLKSWSFQYNEATNDYSVFFALLTDSEQYISADVNVDVRIVNDNDEEVYKETHSVSDGDFGYYSSQISETQYLANLRIPAASISSGTSANGKVYITVYKEYLLRFDEVYCEAFYCLPIKDVQLTVDSLPQEINVTGYDGRVESKIKIEEVQYTYDKFYTSQLEITVLGIKTYGGTDSDYDIISYKIYDSEGYVVDSGDLYLTDLSVNDKFKDDSIVVYDVVPGENYKIVFSECVW